MKNFIFILWAVMLTGCASVEISRDVYIYNDVDDFDSTEWIAYRIVAMTSTDGTTGEEITTARRETVLLSFSSKDTYGLCQMQVSIEGLYAVNVKSYYYHYLTGGYIELCSINDATEKVALCMVNNSRLTITSWPDAGQYEGLVFIRNN